MRAARLHGIRDIRISDEPVPAPGPGECLVEVKAVSICGSDIHVFAEGNVGGISWDGPFIPGHEFAGVCHGGESIPDGTMVVADPAISCWRCDMCQSGWPHLCRNLEFCGLPPRQGALQSQLAWPEHALFPAPSSLSFAEAALIEPLAVAVHGVALAPPPPGARVAIIGCGGIGLTTLQVARAAGASEVLVTDLVPERLELARRLGATATVNSSREDPVAAAAEWSGGRGADVVYEAAGAADTPAQAVQMARSRSTVAIIGIPVEDEMRIPVSRARRNELSLRWVRRQNHDYRAAIELLEKGLVKLPPLLTHRFPLEEANAAFALAESKKDGALRIAVEL